MFKITKLVLLVAVVCSMVVFTGCGGGGDDDTIANVAGVWMVTFDGDVDPATIVQDGHNLTMTDSDEDSVSGEIYGTSVTFSATEMDEGVLVTMEMNLTLDSEETPSVMTGDVEGIVDGAIIFTEPIVCVKQ